MPSRRTRPQVFTWTSSDCVKRESRIPIAVQVDFALRKWLTARGALKARSTTNAKKRRGVMPWWTKPKGIAAIGTAAATMLLALGYVVPILCHFCRRPVLQDHFWKRIARLRSLQRVQD